MKLGTTYICVKNMQQSLSFYQTLLQIKPLRLNENRWVTFNCGNYLSLYNKSYDQKIIDSKSNNYFNQAYISNFRKNTGELKNNIVILNLEVEDLKAEYERLKKINIGDLSELMYVNIHMPYWYFTIKDPDGNVLEITGNYN